MATRKHPKSSTTMALTASPDAAQIPADLIDELTRYAQQYADSSSGLAGAGWGFISTKGGKFTYKQQPLASPLRVAVLGYVFENTYYDRDFDPEMTTPPKCTAIGREVSLMGPPPTWISKESETCRECKQNAWGSGRGRGKACANRVRLALLPIYRGVEVEKEDGARMRVPPTSLPNFHRFVTEVKALNSGQAPLFAYLTEIDLVPDQKTMFKMTFTLLGTFPGEMIRALKNRVAECQDPLLQIFEGSEDQRTEERPRKSARRAGARR